jgi:hypothetical protein
MSNHPTSCKARWICSSYALTRAGRAQLEKELANWERLSSAVGLVIRVAEE